MKKIITIALIAGAATLTGCATGGPNQQFGTLVGGALGGVAGHQFGHGQGKTAATIAGTMVGAGIGGNLGNAVDYRNQAQYAQPQYAQPYGGYAPAPQYYPQQRPYYGY